MIEPASGEAARVALRSAAEGPGPPQAARRRGSPSGAAQRGRAAQPTIGSPEEGDLDASGRGACAG
jgi:hypothetical protein